MKTFLKISAAGLLLALPAVAGASQVNFEATNPCYTLLFDPSGCGSTSLPKTGFYRSYNCRIGSVYTPPKITWTPPPTDNKPPGNNDTNQTPPPSNGNNDNPNPTNTPPSNTPPVNPPTDPGTPVCTPASVPAPQSGPMAAVGLGLIGAFSWLRSRRKGRA